MIKINIWSLNKYYCKITIVDNTQQSKQIQYAVEKEWLIYGVKRFMSALG